MVCTQNKSTPQWKLETHSTRYKRVRIKKGTELLCSDVLSTKEPVSGCLNDVPHAMVIKSRVRVPKHTIRRGSKVLDLYLWDQAAGAGLARKKFDAGNKNSVQNN